MTTFEDAEKQTQTAEYPIIKVAELEDKCFTIKSCDIRDIHSEKYGDCKTAVCHVVYDGTEYIGFFRQTAIVNTLDRMVKNSIDFPVDDVTVAKRTTKNGITQYWVLTAYKSAQ